MLECNMELRVDAGPVVKTGDWICCKWHGGFKVSGRELTRGSICELREFCRSRGRGGNEQAVEQGRSSGRDVLVSYPAGSPKDYPL